MDSIIQMHPQPSTLLTIFTKKNQTTKKEPFKGGNIPGQISIRIRHKLLTRVQYQHSSITAWYDATRVQVTCYNSCVS